VNDSSAGAVTRPELVHVEVAHDLQAPQPVSDDPHRHELVAAPQAEEFERVAAGQHGLCRDQPSALVGIDRWFLLGSTVGFCWDRPSAFAGIDRKLQGELC
jgi:hypothetical protein